MTKPLSIVNGFVFVIGMIVLVGGTYSSVEDIVSLPFSLFCLDLSLSIVTVTSFASIALANCQYRKLNIPRAQSIAPLRAPRFPKPFSFGGGLPRLDTHHQRGQRQQCLGTLHIPRTCSQGRSSCLSVRKRIAFNETGCEDLVAWSLKYPNKISLQFELLRTSVSGSKCFGETGIPNSIVASDTAIYGRLWSCSMADSCNRVGNIAAAGTLGSTLMGFTTCLRRCHVESCLTIHSTSD